MMISRRYFIRQIIILALGFVLELFGYKPKKEEQVSNFYKFEMGKSRLRIKSDESFNVKICWPTENPNLTPMDLKVQMSGIMFSNLDGSPVPREEVDQILAEVMPAPEEI